MNGTRVIRSIIWKEYRLQRPFWIALAVLIVFVQFLFAMFITNSEERALWLFGSAMVGTALYAWGCGATLFAAEHENGTFAFQKQLPVSAPRLALGKIYLALLSAAALLVFLLLTAFLWDWIGTSLRQDSLVAPPSHWVKVFLGIFGLAIFELPAWGIFYSLILRRPLLAAILAIASASICIHIPIFATEMLFAWGNYINVIPYLLLILALVAAADVWLAARWLKEENLWTQWRTRREMQPIKQYLPYEVSYRPSIYSRNPFPWLFWQQLRQNGWIALIVSGLLILLLIMSGQNFAYESYSFPYLRRFYSSFWTYLVGLIVILLWSMMFFHADNVRRSFRFLAERGVSPNMVWLSRQVLGIFPLILTGLIYIIFITLIQFVFVYKNFYVFDRENALPAYEFLLFGASIGFLVLAFFSVYSVVQFCTLFFRSGLLAGFFSVLFTVLLISWAELMVFWVVPWWWSVLPLPFLLLLATWLRTPGWLLERNNLRAWLRPVLAFLAIAAIVVAVPFYRIYSVPWVEPDISVAQFTRPPTPAALATAKLYEQAWNEYVEFPQKAKTEETPEKVAEEPKNQPWTPPPPLTADERTWVAANAKTIQLTIEASKGVECHIPQNEKWGTTWVQDAVSDLCRLLILSARQLQGDGQSEAAWQHYVAALRVADHAQARWYYFTNEIYQQLPFWAAGKETTPEQIRLAIEELKKMPPDISWLRKWQIERYMDFLDLLQGKENRNYYHLIGKEKPNFSIGFWLWRQFLPWERIRAERLLNIQLRAQLDCLDRLENWLKHDQPIYWATQRDDYVYERRESALALRNEVVLPGNVWFFDDYWDRFEYIRQVDLYRATLIELALVSWKKTHGAYPNDLKKIKEIIGGALPMDPYPGRPFRYMPQGFTTSWEMKDPFWREYILQAKHPFLWSTGENVEYVRQAPEEENLYEPEIVEWQWIGHSERGKVYITPKSDQELYSHGITFPLP